VVVAALGGGFAFQAVQRHGETTLNGFNLNVRLININCFIERFRPSPLPWSLAFSILVV
jgi:hypothetical protein